jgi:hypothetical protein
MQNTQSHCSNLRSNWVCHAVCSERISLQELWEEGIDWDDELAPSSQKKWSSHFEEMKQLNGVSFKSCICPRNIVEQAIMCVFADASPSNLRVS